MSTNIETPARGPDRFFFGKVDGQEKLFVLHWDHSISIAPTQPAIVVSTEEVINELQGLAA